MTPLPLNGGVSLVPSYWRNIIGVSGLIHSLDRLRISRNCDKYWLLALHIRTGELVMVMDSERVLSTKIHSLWPQTRYLPSKPRIAIDAMVAEIPALMN